MKLSICSFSFHRLLQAGEQDIFRYITDCRDFGCTQLDPWNAHLAGLGDAETVQHARSNPWAAQLPPKDDAYLTEVKDAADAAGLPFGCIAVDGAHIYEADVAARQANRALAYRWLEIAAKLGACQIRIDAGKEQLPLSRCHRLFKNSSRHPIRRVGTGGNRWESKTRHQHMYVIRTKEDGVMILHRHVHPIR